MALLSQPTPEFIECLARRALALFERFGRGSPIRHMTAFGTADYWYYVRRAFEEARAEGPWFECSIYGRTLVHEALAQHLQHGVELREAVANVKRWKRRNSRD